MNSNQSAFTNGLPSLTAVELSIYTKAKNRLRGGQKDFVIEDLDQVDGIEVAIESLIKQGLVVINAPGVYSLARRPILKECSTNTVTQKLIKKAQVKPSRIGDIRERLRQQLLAGLAKTLKLAPPKTGFGTGTPKARTCYTNILRTLDTYNATIENFVWYVCQRDWSKIGFPGLGLLGSTSFLDEASWYFVNKDKLQDMNSVIDTYNNTFGARSSRGLRELQLALSIYSTCQELGTTVSSFFTYARSKMRNRPPSLTIFSSQTFLEEYRFSQKTSFTGLASNTYLGKILERLSQIPNKLSSKDLEDHNWQLAEAIFEPLQKLVSTNGNYKQLQSLVRLATHNKQRPTFGKYVIDWEGKFTPLAVCWIAHASKYLDSFAPLELDWKTIVKEKASRHVNLGVLQ